MYLLPLCGLIAAPILLGALFSGLSEGWLIVAGAGGFALGLMLVRRWLRTQGQRFDPVLLGYEPARSSLEQVAAGGLSRSDS